MQKEISINSSLQGLRAYEYECDNPCAAVCCIHGIGEHFGRYERIAGFFNENNIALVGMDLRGHGRTPGKRGHCAPRTDILSDVDALIDYVADKYKNIPVILYGHSMGGNIGLDYRYRGHKNDIPYAYIISAPWIRLADPVPDVLLGIVKALSKVMPSFTIGSSIDESILGNPVSVGPYKDDPMVHNKISFLTAYECSSIGNALYNGTYEHKGEGYKKPLLLMHGDLDKICDVVGSRKVAAIEGNLCEYVEWENVFHEIHNGGTQSTGEEVIMKMISWIKEIAGTKEEK